MDYKCSPITRNVCHIIPLADALMQYAFIMSFSIFSAWNGPVIDNRVPLVSEH